MEQTTQGLKEKGRRNKSEVYILMIGITLLILFSFSSVQAKNLVINSSTTICGDYKYENITIESGVTVTICDYNGTSWTGILNFTAENTFTLESGATIQGSGKGYRGGAKSTAWVGYAGEGYGSGNGGFGDTTGDPMWLGGGGGAGYGANGGYGGSAGIGTGGSSGQAYGDILSLNSTFRGSGGGSGATDSAGGDSGVGGDGGASFIVDGRTIEIHGSIYVSGNNGGSGSATGGEKWAGSGGGSGGSIFIKGKFVNLSSATLESKGGSGSSAYYYAGDYGAAGGGGGGSGGRISLVYQYTIENTSTSFNVNGGGGGQKDLGVSGTASNGGSGGSGVINYTKNATFNVETLTELLSAYSFDYVKDFFEIDEINDSLINNNTLQFNLSILNTTNGNYSIYLDLYDNTTIITRTSNITYNGTPVSAVLNISTYILSGSESFNYTLRAYDQNGSLVYREGDFQTNNYSYYIKGPNILSIDEWNNNNDSIVFNITLNSTINLNEDMILSLEYNTKPLLITVDNVSIGSGETSVLFELDNESIKLTHCNGSFDLKSLSIGERIINLNLTTDSYFYEDFAKTSYIKSFSENKVDLDSNNLTDYIELTTGILVVDSGDYTLELDIYDLEDNYLMTLIKNQSLSTGYQEITSNISGEDIYLSRLNGPYEIVIANLLYNSELVDRVENSYLIGDENDSYNNFERPPLPDLLITNISTAFNDTNNLFNITIKNSGEIKAFNVILDLFDNTSLDVKEGIEELDVNESYTFEIVSETIANNSLVVAVVDFENLIEELNESNNVASVSTTSYNTAPGEINILYPTPGSILNGLALILWQPPIDINNDFIKYFIDYSSDGGNNWNNIISNLGYLSKWGDDSQNKSFSFSSGGGSEVVYLKIPKNATIQSAKLNLHGETQ